MLLDRSKAPKFKIPKDFTLSEPAIFQLTSRAKLYYFRTPGIGAVKLEILGDSQRASLPVMEQATAFFTLQMLREGTSDYSGNQIAEILDFFGSEVGPVSSFNKEGIQLLTTKKHLKEVLPLFLSFTSKSNFPAGVLEKKKHQKKLAIKIDNEKTSTQANNQFRKGLFGENHPYGVKLEERHIDLLTKEKLQKYYSNKLWVKTEIFLSGDFDEAELKELVIKIDEKVPYKESNADKVDWEDCSTQRIHLEIAKAVQSSLRVGGFSIPKNHPDSLALSVFNTFLGGYFGSRLSKNIREDKGHTYGIYSSLQSIGKANYFLIGAEVQKKYALQVLEEVNIEIKKLVFEPIPIEELETVRNYLIGQMLAQFSNSFDTMDRFKAVHFSDLDMNFYSDKLAFIKGFSQRDITEIGQKYFSKALPLEVLVG